MDKVIFKYVGSFYGKLIAVFFCGAVYRAVQCGLNSNMRPVLKEIYVALLRCRIFNYALNFVYKILKRIILNSVILSV